MKFEDIRLKDIPRELIEDISQVISNYLVGIVKVKEVGTDKDAILCGSGTLVDINGFYGILTAHHVLDALSHETEIGLIIDSSLHRFTIRSDFVQMIPVARGSIDSEGPDLAIIILPNSSIGQLKAKKSFYNLSLRCDKIINNPPENKMGIWFLCGFSDELTADEGPEKGYEKVKRFCGICGAGGVEKQYTNGEYDYLEFQILYGGSDEPPRNFGGFSGGGLWQVPLIISKERVFEVSDYILSGVAFYQTPFGNNRRSIKCHGRRSIYNIAFNSVK